MNIRHIVGSLASALLLALLFVPGGAGSATTSGSVLDDECQPVIDGSCIHCHADGVCLSCIVYLDAGVSGVGHLLNHCLHG